MTHPNTQVSLRDDLSALGLKPGMTVMVHSALGQVGWTVGGPVSVIRALLEVLGEAGTLVMPAETPQLGDPGRWSDPRVKSEWYDVIRAHLPPFDPATTPTSMGTVPEAFRSFPGTLRSHHPLVSVCANGRQAEVITKDHVLEFCEGRGSPFEKLYELDAYTLLLGVGFNRCTSLHFAESLTPNRRTQKVRLLMLRDGQRSWVEVLQMGTDGGRLFPRVGDAFMETGSLRRGRVGQADALLFSTRALVDFAEDYFTRVL